MNFLGFGKKDLTDDRLRERLFDLAADNKARALNNVIDEHRERIRVLFRSWTTLPPDVRSDPTMTRWWCEGMIHVAKIFHQAGDPSLLALLVGDPPENVLIRWGDALAAGQAEIHCGNHTKAIPILEDALKYAEGLTGTALDEILPKHYGLLGHAYFLAGNRESARTFTVKARNYCERIGDQEGVAIYTSNLAHIDSA
jgi:hypothetical protein